MAATLSCLSFGANAETGTITFVGSVVTPTCQVSTDTSVHDAAADHSCGLEKDKSVRTYRLTTQAIQADSNDQVLRYFFNYLTSAEGHAQHPVLMTLQYD
ncbi:hypothetical protein GCM10007898_02960 [Dyella flagellata]|uniref:Type 1 fimbrial protein n=1 Tax=Dyella flagellata TaxID=1867833 RepID=A0ABQ5X858_9GAMM|nr:hypothetical protein GCM10007898_02960 [Dyella flagellata]